MIRSHLLRTVPACCFLLAVCTLPTSAQDIAKKDPVPDRPAQDKAEQLIRRIFAADFAKRRPADVLELSAKLLQQAKETNDDATARYVLLRMSQNLAAGVGDYAAAFKTIDEMERRYAVNSPQLKAAALAGAIPATAMQHQDALARTALGLVDHALLRDDFETAERLVKIGEVAAQKNKSVPLVTTARNRGKKIEDQKKEYDRLKADFELLQKRPDDPAANARVGKFMCLYKGDWEKGLPLLAKSNDAKLQEPAKNDLAAPEDATAQAVVGDSWYEMAQQQEETAKANLLSRARHWYKLAAEGKLAGLTKTKVETRLKDLEGKAAVEVVPESDSWTVVFRSADPRMWNKNQRVDANNFAVALDKVADDIKFLKLTNTRTGDYYIVPITRDKLTGVSDSGRYGWNGTNKNEYGGYHLGIFDKENDVKIKDTVCVLVPGANQGWRGWGFGHKCDNSGTGFIWDNKNMPATVFEIAVKTGLLSDAESKQLLKK